MGYVLLLRALAELLCITVNKPQTLIKIQPECDCNVNLWPLKKHPLNPTTIKIEPDGMVEVC